MKKKSTLLLIMILSLIMSTTVFAGNKKYYSYNDVGLNYSTTNTSTGSFYGKGKNGYQWVMVTAVKGNKISYRKAQFVYDKAIGHHRLKAYGKTYKATLTSGTKYYKSTSWSRIYKLRAYNYKYASKTFKGLKILDKVKKSSLFGTYYKSVSYYIKVTKGKVKTIVSPCVLAM